MPGAFQYGAFQGFQVDTLPAFQAGAFQFGAWQVEQSASDPAFQRGAFQYGAWQVAEGIILTPEPERFSGGYGWSNLYERELRRRLRRKIQLEDDEEKVEAALEAAGVALPPSVTEAPPDDLGRLRGLVSAFARQDPDVSKRTERAIDYAKEARTRLAYELALRAIAKELEDEEAAIVTLLHLI